MEHLGTRSKGPSSKEDDANLKRIRELEEELDRQTKRANTAEAEKKTAKASMNSIAQEYICPISHELMIDPVTAEDGFQYDREEIEKTIKTQGGGLRSPKTGLKMGPKLLPAITVRNTIEHLVESGIIDGQLAEHYKENKMVAETKKKAEGGDIDAMESLAEWYRSGENGLPEDEDMAKEWQKKAEDAKHVRELREKAEVGDAEAMHLLGRLYSKGKNGLPKNKEEAFRWYNKSADLKNPNGMASAGMFIADGLGGAEVNVARAIFLTSVAAEKGSDVACYNLGIWHMHGLHGLPKDKGWAKHWLTKATDGSCVYPSFTTSHKECVKERVKGLLRELEEE